MTWKKMKQFFGELLVLICFSGLFKRYENFVSFLLGHLLLFESGHASLGLLVLICHSTWHIAGPSTAIAILIGTFLAISSGNKWVRFDESVWQLNWQLCLKSSIGQTISSWFDGSIWFIYLKIGSFSVVQ